MTTDGGTVQVKLGDDLRATLCGLVEEARRTGKRTLRGIIGDDGVQAGKAVAPDRHLRLLQNHGYIRVVDEGDGVEKTIEVHQQAIDACPPNP